MRVVGRSSWAQALSMLLFMWYVCHWLDKRRIFIKI